MKIVDRKASFEGPVARIATIPRLVRSGSKRSAVVAGLAPTLLERLEECRHRAPALRVELDACI